MNVELRSSSYGGIFDVKMEAAYMPRGEARRVWYPEMVEILRTAWQRGISWSELADLCKELTVLRDKIKRANGEMPATSKRCACGGTLVQAPISIRSALFALAKDGTLSASEQEVFDAEWLKYKRTNKLDGWGDPKGSKLFITPNRRA